MNKNISILFVLAYFILVASCAKDKLWLSDNNIPDNQKGRIVGKLISDEDQQAIKGVKILFERQTDTKGKNSFVDTVSTNENGEFSYSIPFPNKVRIAIRDTGRYQADTASLEILESKDYPISLTSHPRFGVANVLVNVKNTSGNNFEGVHVALYVRDNNTESYSTVDTVLSDADGNVEFQNIAFPVYYKVKIAEREIAYQLDSLEGKLTTKNDLELGLVTRAKFGKGDLILNANYFYTATKAANTDIIISYKSILDDSFSTPETIKLDANGQYILPDMVYPGELKISSPSSLPFPFTARTIVITEEMGGSPIQIDLFDISPRYADLTPSGVMAENTLVAFYDGVSIQEMELDSKGNIYAVTTDGNLVRIAHDGKSSKVLLTGLENAWGIAIVDDYTFYIVENTNANRISKVVLNPQTDEATKTLYAGSSEAKTGTADGIGTAALFNRPSDAVYDKSRNCLWVVEWTGARIRKIDLSNAQVSTLATGTGYGLGMDLTDDNKYLYIASHTSPAGIVKYDIDNKQMYTVYTGYSIRHLTVAPNNDVYFNINGDYKGKQYKITTEVLKPGNVGNTESKFETIVGNGSWGELPPIGYSGSPNITLGTKTQDGSPNGMAYDAYRGRLYFSLSADQRLYYLKNSQVK